MNETVRACILQHFAEALRETVVHSLTSGNPNPKKKNRMGYQSPIISLGQRLQGYTKVRLKGRGHWTLYLKHGGISLYGFSNGNVAVLFLRNTT